jgi:pimeloyl-ACP methyl ester carboxylesterase
MKKIVFLLSIILLEVTIGSAQDSTLLYTSFDGTKIHYEVKGSGAAVVLVHGFVNTAENWKKTVLYDELLKTGYKVILLDLRGNGLSDKPVQKESYLNDAEAKDIIGLLTMLKVDQYHVVGYSRGAIIASRLLALDKRVSKAVLGGMGSAFTDPQWPRRLMFYRALSGEPTPELDGFMKYIKERGLDPQVLAGQQYGQPSTSKEEFAKNTKPVLVICGDKDEDNGSSEALYKMIPHASYVRPPGDHNNAAKTSEFAGAVVSFLQK